MKVEVVESTVFTADDGTKHDTQEELSNYQFTSYIHDWMDMEDVDSADVVEYIVLNWADFDDARKDIIQKIQRLADAAVKNHNNLKGVL